MILATAAICMALNIYHEARGENIAGQYAVALVTMNRAHHKRKNVCHVVLKPHQFSWTTHLVRGRQLLKAGLPKEKKAWRLAKRIAQVVLHGKMPDFTGGATFYHSTRVHPKWSAAMVRVRLIGDHIFYKLA